jgi:hypothetical protein
MADDIIVEPNQQVDQQAEFKTELANQMAIALGGKMREAQQAATPTAEEAAAAAAAQQAQITDYFSPIKEKFGYQSHEDAIKEIEELRALKAAPPVIEYEFENEQSKKLFEAWQKGKTNEVREYLQREHQIDQYLNVDVTPESAADIVKLGMQLKYKDLSPAEIDYKFKKTFSVPPKPVQSAEEDETEYNQRLSTWQELANDKQMELLIEAKLAKPELTAAKSKLVFPEIDSTEDEGYVQYKKMLEQQPALEAEQIKRDAEAQAAYKAFTPKSIETKLTFIDEPNKINFEFQYEPDPESFSKAVALTTDTETFFKSFYDKDGNPDRKAFLDALYFAKNKDKVILEAIKQGKNAAIKAMLPDNSGGIIRQLNVQAGEPSELDKAMAAAGITRR